MDLGLGIANRETTAQFSSKVRDRNAVYETSLDRFGQSVTLHEDRKEGRWQKMEEKILQNSRKGDLEETADLQRPISTSVSQRLLCFPWEPRNTSWVITCFGAVAVGKLHGALCEMQHQGKELQ